MPSFLQGWSHRDHVVTRRDSPSTLTMYNTNPHAIGYGLIAPFPRYGTVGFDFF